MKKIILLSLAAVCLAGCSSNGVNNGAAGGTSGKIDCYNIRVTEGGTTVFSETYSAGYSMVYEYVSADGSKLYASSYYAYSTGSEIKYSVIRAYPDKYTSDYKEYTYSKLIGFLTRENNYYLDLGARTIDSETKWSEYKYTANPTQVPEGTVVNNKDAISCAKKGYYQDLNFYSDYTTLRLDLTESSLERHTYTMLGEDSIITYRAKWF